VSAIDRQDVTPDISKERGPRESLRTGYTDKHRKVSKDQWEKNWDRTFGKEKREPRR